MEEMKHPQQIEHGGVVVTFELAELMALARLIHPEEERLSGRQLEIAATVLPSGVNRAVGWRWAGEQMEWQPLPSAELPEDA